MKRIIELKHVGPKRLVRGLLDDLLDRLEERLGHLAADVVSAHVLFEENPAHKLYRAALTCHVPGRTAAAHEESHDPGDAIRGVFAEVGRQLQKHKVLRRDRFHKRAGRQTLRHQGINPDLGWLQDGDSAG